MCASVSVEFGEVGAPLVTNPALNLLPLTRAVVDACVNAASAWAVTFGVSPNQVIDGGGPAGKY